MRYNYRRPANIFVRIGFKMAWLNRLTFSFLGIIIGAGLMYASADGNVVLGNKIITILANDIKGEFAVRGSRVKLSSEETKVLNNATSTKQKTGPVVSDGTCGEVGPKHLGLSTSSLPQLRKIAEYEEVCNGSIISRSSMFIDTPVSDAAAEQEADWVARALKEYSKQGIAPLIFFEPVGANGILNLSDYGNGAYDGPLNTFFAALKAKGITDATMGLWVPIPEGNIPVWKNVNAGDFSRSVTRAVTQQKKHFPGSKAAVLLETKTYHSGAAWAGGQIVSLSPYVRDIPKGLIDSFGLQGFAWPPTALGNKPLLNASEFLRAGIAQEAAQILGVKDIWFNTNAYNKSLLISNSPESLNPEARQMVLKDIANIVSQVKSNGFQVAVHVFAQDKSGLSEKIDWSYWPDGRQAESLHTPVFRSFANDLKAEGIEMWLFDLIK